MHPNNSSNSNQNTNLLDFYIRSNDQIITRINALYDNLNENRSMINLLNEVHNPHITQRERDRRERERRYREVDERLERERNNRRFNNNYQGNNNNFQRNNRHLYSGSNNVQRTNNAQRNNDMLEENGDNRTITIQGVPYRVEIDNLYLPNTRIPATTIPATIQTNRPVTTIPATTSPDIYNLLQSFYSNVSIIATLPQIRDATRELLFSEISNPINSNCPITLEPFSNNSPITEILGCNHLFGRNALSLWFENNVRCPVCRYDIRNYRNTSSEESKEETHLEESKEELPFDSSLNQTNLPIPEQNIERRISNTLNQVTENLLGQLFNQQTTNRINPQQFQYFDIITYDLSFNI
jgi:hypothetical protein